MKAPAFPNCSIFIDCVDFYMSTIMWTNEEVGMAMRNIFKEATKGNFKYLEQFPWIVRYQKGWKKRKSLPLSLRSHVLSQGKCVICGATDRLTVDHIIPICRGGSDNKTNLQCLCWTCNRKKGPERNG